MGEGGREVMGKGVKEARGRQGKGAGDARREGKEQAGEWEQGERREEGFDRGISPKIPGFRKLYISYMIL